MSVKIETVSDRALVLGEGPHWDAREQALYFVDLMDSSIHKHSAAGHTKTKLDGAPSFIIPVEGQPGQFVVGIGLDVAVVQWDGTEGGAARVVRTVGTAEGDTTVKHKFNDGKADPRGRLYTGSLAAEKNAFADETTHRKGALYRVDKGGVTKLDDKITLSNGLAWDLAAGAMYYNDSLENKIRRYDYDVETGNISNMIYIYEYTATSGIIKCLDGMTIDTDGNLWVAVFNTSCIHQVSPRGELLRQIQLPAKQVTSCTFGGPELDELFVTSGYIDVGAGELGPPNGYTFKISGLGVKGHPNVNVKL